MKTIRNSFLLLLICTISVYSQQNDFQIWSSIKISKKIYKRTNLSVKEGLRFRENASIYTKSFTDIKLSHRIKKTDFELSAAYRFIEVVNTNFIIDYNNRYYFDFSSKYKFNRFKFSLRDRFQLQGNNSNYTAIFRQKTEVSYNVRKTPFEPFVQLELFINFNQQFEKLRYTTGFSYPIMKDLDATIFYRIQDDLITDIPKNLYILGSSISYKL